MDRDHREICKFDNPENGDFQAVCCQIEKMVEGAAANAVTMRVVARGRSLAREVSSGLWLMVWLIALVKVAMFGLNPKIRSIPSWEEARPSSERAKDPKTSGGKTKDPKTSGGRTKDSKTSWRIKEVNPSIEEKKTGSGGRTKGKKTSSGSKKTSDGRSAKRKDPKDGIRA